MSHADIISIVESSMHPNYSQLYAEKGLSEIKVNTIRKAISLLKKNPAKYVVAEFFYAYSTNYSGVHKSNLDVLLLSLKKYSPETRVIVFADKQDAQFIQVLDTLDYPLHGCLVYPVDKREVSTLLN